MRVADVGTYADCLASRRGYGFEGWLVVCGIACEEDDGVGVGEAESDGLAWGRGVLDFGIGEIGCSFGERWGRGNKPVPAPTPAIMLKNLLDGGIVMVGF